MTTPTDISTIPTSPVNVAVLGLGPMGIALARTLLAAGQQVTVWNRSPKDLEPLGLRGANLAEHPADAVADADTVVVCLRDHTASREVIDAMRSRLGQQTTVLNLTTGSPDEAVASANHAAAQGIAYITGAIMVPTPLIGEEDSLILYAGVEADFAAAAPTIRALGGVADLVGTDHARPPVLDMAMLDIYFAGMYAFLHSAAMARAHGIEPSSYLPYADGIVRTLGSSLSDLATSYETHDYSGGEGRLDMCLSFLRHIVTTSEGAGVDAALPRLIRDVTEMQMGRVDPGTDWNVVAEGFMRT
ncbi:NAD(P)-binding domain-containing protein [Knoellia sp. S7-12]|uniref:NAD(P)-dependent oxidoreductase n=1 Tax=Knoellia sp. S7-12 TaxID=3126698 RepID=UPI0033685788